MTVAEFEEKEKKRMKSNAFKVCEEVASRIDGAPAPDGYLKGLVTNDLDDLFFWYTKYLKMYIGSFVISPGYHYYDSLGRFISSHCRKGDKFAEFIRCSKIECPFCECKPWSRPKTLRIPQPMPDPTSDRSYLHVKDTPSHI